MDWIRIEGLTIDAVIGVYDWEQATHQLLTFDIDLGTDIRQAAASDDLADTLNYAALSDEVKQIVRAGRPALLETLVEQIAQAMLAHAGVQTVRVSVLKHGCIVSAKGARITIERRHG